MILDSSLKKTKQKHWHELSATLLNLSDEEIIAKISKLAMFFNENRHSHGITSTCCLLSSVIISNILIKSGIQAKISTCGVVVNSKQYMDLALSMDKQGVDMSSLSEAQIKHQMTLGVKQVIILRQENNAETNELGGHVVVFIKMPSKKFYLCDPTAYQFRRPTINCPDGVVFQISNKMFDKGSLFVEKELKNNIVIFQIDDGSIFRYDFGPIPFIKRAMKDKKIFNASDLNIKKYADIYQLMSDKWVEIVLS